MSRTTNRQGNKSGWKRKDRKYREQEKARRQANARRRSINDEAIARGVTYQQVEQERAEAAA